MDTLPKPYLLAVRYTQDQLKKLLAKEVFGKIHPFVKDWDLYSVCARTYRIDLQPRAKSALGVTGRDANLFELLAFTALHLDWMEENSQIQGYDQRLEDAAKESGIPLSLPVVSFNEGKLDVALLPSKKENSCKYVLSEIEFIK